MVSYPKREDITIPFQLSSREFFAAVADDLVPYTGGDHIRTEIMAMLG